MKLIHLLAFVPFLGMLGLLPFVNKVTPYLLGMPFMLFWMVIWVVLTSLCMLVMYKLDKPATEEEAQ